MIPAAPGPFSDEEVDRYARHLVLREIGGAGQQRLKAARVLIVGAGGVGCPAAAYLVAAGVGRLGLVDFDAISLSNLQRQVLFATGDVGRLKVEAARERLGELNPHVETEALPVKLDAANAAAIVRRFDLVIDGSDNFDARFAVNRACLREGRTLISAALGRWDGLVGAFQGRPCYRCLVPEAPPDADTCAAVGVVGALAGVVGSLAALSAIRIITDAGPPEFGRMFFLDALGGRSRTLTVSPDPGCPDCSGSAA